MGTDRLSCCSAPYSTSFAAEAQKLRLVEFKATWYERGMLKSLLIAVACVALAGCASVMEKFGSVHEDPSILRVAICPDTPPYAYKTGGKLKGVEVEFANELGKDLRRSVVFLEMRADQLIPAVEKNHADIVMSGLKVSDALAMRVAFTRPYLETGQMILMRAGDAARYLYPEVVLLSDARIATVKGTLGDMMVANATRNTKRKVFSTIEKAVAALQHEKADAVIHDGPVILMQAALHSQEGVRAMKGQLTKEYLAWALNRDNTRLRDDIEQLQTRWAADGTADEILTDALPFLH